MTNTNHFDGGINPATITAKQLKALRDEAAAAGDDKQVAICEIAINGADETGLVRMSQARATEMCCEAINAASAQS